MLRFIYNGKVATKSMNSLATSFMRCMSIQQNPQSLEQRKPFKERLEVNLCGRISESPTKLDSGTIIIPFKTRNDNDEHYTKHRAMLLTSRVPNFLADRLIEGQRIYVSGVIGYSEFQNAEGRRRQSGHVSANNIFLCEENEDPNSDVNEVRLFGRVPYQPQNSETATFLDVATWFFSGKEQAYKRRLHQILIKDDVNMRNRANCVDVGANVFIQGSLKAESYRNKDDKSRSVYFILPTKLVVSQQRENRQDADADEY